METTEKPKTKTVATTTEDKFGKEALLKYFEDDATLLNILLEDDQSYSLAEVRRILEDWRKGVAN